MYKRLSNHPTIGQFAMARNDHQGLDTTTGSYDVHWPPEGKCSMQMLPSCDDLEAVVLR